MTHSSDENGRPLRRRERMEEREVDRSPRLGAGWWDFGIRGERLEQEPWTLTPNVVRDPSSADLKRELDSEAEKTNGGGRLRLVPPLSPNPILGHPHGLLEDNGLPLAGGSGFAPKTSAVGAAWFTRGGVKCVRVWGYRWHTTGLEHSYLFLPDPSDKEGIRCCWASVFPRRFFRLRVRRQERIRRILEHVGPPGEDDRVNLSLARARIRAHVPGLGVILSDDRARTQLAQVVVRDPSTGHRHHLSVPPRFGNPRTKTFRGLRTAEARIHAAVAWTFGMRPEEYEPALEA